MFVASREQDPISIGHQSSALFPNQKSHQIFPFRPKKQEQEMFTLALPPSSSKILPDLYSKKLCSNPPQAPRSSRGLRYSENHASFPSPSFQGWLATRTRLPPSVLPRCDDGAYVLVEWIRRGPSPSSLFFFGRRGRSLFWVLVKAKCNQGCAANGQTLSSPPPSSTVSFLIRELEDDPFCSSRGSEEGGGGKGDLCIKLGGGEWTGMEGGIFESGVGGGTVFVQWRWVVCVRKWGQPGGE